jgi:HlyD family secretion protein
MPAAPVRSWITWTVVGSVALVLVVLALRPGPIRVDMATAVANPLVTVVNGEALTRVRDRYLISAPVSGRLQRIALRAGDSVSSGTIVARIGPALLDPQSEQQARARFAAAEALQREALTRLVQAREALAQSEHALARARALESAGALSRQQRELAELEVSNRRQEVLAIDERAMATAADVRQAAAVLLAAGASGDDAVVGIRSPAAGRILRVPDPSARVIPAGAPILEIGSPGFMEIVIDVLSADAVRVIPGAAVRLTDWGGDSTLAGTVRYVEPSATTRLSALGVEEQRVNVIADLAAPVAALGDGFRLDASIEIWSAPSVLQVPASALFRRGSEWNLFAVRDERAQLTPVQIGHRSDAWVEITGGLAAGDTVILFPSDQLSSGTRVRGR